ncbi:hypothetical protein V8D89_002239 [Ganoderma adspersum]
MNSHASSVCVSVTCGHSSGSGGLKHSMPPTNPCEDEVHTPPSRSIPRYAHLAHLSSLVAIASVVAATPGLDVRVTGPEAVDGVENFKVVATLTDTGDETLKLLNDPRGALHALPTSKSVITTTDGVSPDFTGVMVKFSLDNASVFTVLAPGQSASVTHDLSLAYDFTSTGHGTYTVGASDLFHYISANNTVSSLRATASPHSVILTGGELAIARRTGSLARVVKRAQSTGCSSSQHDALNAAAPAAQNYTAGALAYLVHNTINSSAARYTTWFGAPTDERYGVVVGHFASINSHDFTTFTYDCTCTKSGLASYVDPDDFGVPSLLGRVHDGDGLAGGGARPAASGHKECLTRAMLSPAVIFNFDGACRDFVTGQNAAKSLAQSDPDQAVFNADNHQYFADDSR